MMMRKPCSRRIATSSAVAPVAQGTPNSLQAARTRSTFSCTAGWLASPRKPIDTDMSRGLPFAKTSPAAAAEAILDGIEAGEEEIFPDPASRQMGEAFLASPKALERTVAAGGLS